MILPPQYFYMYSRLYLVLILTVFIAGSAIGQDSVPTPTPTPLPAKGVQNVQPEDLKGVPAIAPNYRSEDQTLPDLGRVGVEMTDQRPLTLEQAITLALENSSDIEVTRKQVRVAEFDLEAARGVYQPRLTGETYFERASLPNLSFFTPDISKTTTNSFIGNAGIQAFLPSTGTMFDGRFTNQRATADNPITIFSPQYNSGLEFTVTQPLFRGRRFDQKRRVIEVAKKNVSLTDMQFRQKSIDIVNTTQRAYWDLTYALRNLQVQRDGTRDAKDQLEHNRRLVDEGQLAPIDVIAAETQVANFEQAVYDALNAVTIAENNLKNVISSNRNDKIWSEAITPVESVDVKVPDVTLSESMNAALANRPELEINEARKDINDIEQRYFRDQTKPKIDLVASYRSSGVGGIQNPNFSNPLLRNCIDDPTLPECVAANEAQTRLLQNVGSGSTAYSDIFANKYPTYRIGVQFDLPLFGDKTAKAQLGSSRVQGEILETQRAQIEQNIQVEVRNALQLLRTAQARLRAASLARENSAKQYESEQRKLDAGQSDIYKVLERQTALTAARSNELRAQTELNKAIGDLERATGNSLKANNIETTVK
jgi:HAE1 family hydrophobic/amphiphilic exporter-1